MMVKCDKNLYSSKRDDDITKAYLQYGTVRKVEYHLKWSKTTVHKVLRELISQRSHPDWEKIYQLIEKNKEERARRGGKAVHKRNKQL